MPDYRLQNDALSYLESLLDKDIVTVNVYDKLNRHKDEYIYFRTVSLTALGAYYAYVNLWRQGRKPLPLNNLKIDLGDFRKLIYKTLDKSLEKIPTVL